MAAEEIKCFPFCLKCNRKAASVETASKSISNEGYKTSSYAEEQ